MKFNLEKFSLHLRLKQAENRIKAKQAADEIGISKATLSRLNNEQGLPDVETFFRCCAWLNQDMDSFFNSQPNQFTGIEA